MKKTILTLTLVLLFFAPVVLSQEEAKTNIATKTDKPQEEEKGTVITTLEAAKSGQIKIEKTSEQLVKEKEEIEKQKAVLVTNGAGSPVETPEAKKQLKFLEQQRQLIEAKEKAIEERIEATEKTIAILEQKIQIIGSGDLTLNDIRLEAKKTRKALSEDQKEKADIVRQIPLINMEAKAVEKELTAQKLLLDLKEKDKNAIKDSIKTNEVRLESARTEIDLMNERVAFINVQIEIEKNYLSVLWEKRLDILQKKLLVAKPYTFNSIDAALLLILFVCLLCISIIRRKSKENGIQEKAQVTYAGFSVKSLKKIFLGGAIFSGIYFVLSFSGYHQLIIYLTYRAVLIAVVAVILLGVQRLIKMFFQQIISAGEEGSKERSMIKAFLDMASTLLGWGLFFLGVFLVVEILGLRHEAIEFIIQAAQKPFFTLGNVNLSVWLLFKVLIILWVFITGSNLLDGFLRKNVYKRVHLDESVQYTFSVTIKYIMLIIGVLIGLSSLGVELAALTVFAGTIGIGIGFGLQDIAKNFISGLVMLVERPVKVGDYIEVKGLPGKVKAIKARSTIVDTFDNISVIVPNAEFMNQQVVNWSYSDRITRLKLPVGVAYGTDPELVKTTLLEAAKSHPEVLRRPESYVWFTEFGDSSLNFELYIWTNDPNNRFTIKSQINFEINRLFKEKGIKIPFPQRDVHFKSSDVPLK